MTTYTNIDAAVRAVASATGPVIAASPSGVGFSVALLQANRECRVFDAERWGLLSWYELRADPPPPMILAAGADHAPDFLWRVMIETIPVINSKVVFRTDLEFSCRFATLEAEIVRYVPARSSRP